MYLGEGCVMRLVRDVSESSRCFFELSELVRVLCHRE